MWTPQEAKGRESVIDRHHNNSCPHLRYSSGHDSNIPSNDTGWYWEVVKVLATGITSGAGICAAYWFWLSPSIGTANWYWFSPGIGAQSFRAFRPHSENLRRGPKPCHLECDTHRQQLLLQNELECEIMAGQSHHNWKWVRPLSLGHVHIQLGRGRGGYFQHGDCWWCRA